MPKYQMKPAIVALAMNDPKHGWRFRVYLQPVAALLSDRHPPDLGGNSDDAGGTEGSGLERRRIGGTISLGGSHGR